MINNLLLDNKIINKAICKICTLFVFNKEKRRKIREKFFNKRVISKLNTLLDEHKDFWIFSLFFPLGDLGIACALIKEFKKEHGGKVLVLANSKNRADVARLFPAIDKVLVVDSEIYDYIFRNPNLKIEKGNYFELNHWKFYNAPRYKSENFLELYAHMMDLSDWQHIESPHFTEDIKQHVYKEISKLNIDITKTIFISKDSNSFNCSALSDDFWLTKAKKYREQGFEVVFNSKEIFWNGYKTIFLPMAEQLYFCSLCKKIIAIRSGFNDLLGLMKLENLEIYYPKSMFFNTTSPIEQLIEFKRAFKDEEDKSFNENMYRITSMKMFGIKNLKEIIAEG